MKTYLIGGTAILIVVLCVLLKNSYERNGELEVKLKVQAEATTEAADANDSNMVTIIELEEKIAVMIEERRVDAELREQVLMEREKELATARLRADLLEEKRNDEINTNSDCADLASLSVGFFCPIVGDQLRERSRGPSSNGDTND